MVKRMIGATNGESGYIALLAVLIVGAGALAISLVLLTTSVDSQRATLVIQRSKQARALTIACAQEALQVMHDDTTYTGNGSLNIGSDTCTYTVTSTGVNTRTIDVSADVGNVTRKIQVYVTIGVLNISITSWQEIS